MSVVPGRQRAGIGSLLVATGLRECAGDGVEAVVVVGHPEFYGRFGFRPAREFNLRCEFDVPDDVFMALELRSGALQGRTGVVHYLEEFRAV